jgi:hypothetical protein
MAAAKYTKAFMPLGKVKEKEFLSRPMGCRAVGFSLVRYKPGEGAGLRAPPQGAGRGVHYFAGNGFDHLGREANFDARGNHHSCRSDGLSSPRQRFEKGCNLYDTRSDSSEKLSAWREDAARRRYSQPKEGAAVEKSVASCAQREIGAGRIDA